MTAREQLLEMMRRVTDDPEVNAELLDTLLSDEGRPLLEVLLWSADSTLVLTENGEGVAHVFATLGAMVGYLRERDVLVPLWAPDGSWAHDGEKDWRSDAEVRIVLPGGES